MASERSGRRAWVARRVVASAFVAVHLTATALWVIPPCPLREATLGVVSWYILPLGFWQFWTMFSPDPPLSVLTLDAVAVDARGIRYNFAFPRQADYSVWRAVPRFRHPKFVNNLASPDPEVEFQRQVAARHVLRQLALPAECYPVDVHLVFNIRPCPPPGSTAADAGGQSQPYTVGVYHFANPGEVGR